MHYVISILAVIACVLYPICFAFRKGIPSPPVMLSIATLLAAALEFFDLLSSCNPERVYFWKKASLLFETLIPTAFLWFSLTYARVREKGDISGFNWSVLAFTPLLAGSAVLFPQPYFFYAPDFATEKMLLLGNVGFVFYLMVLFQLIIALINLEMTLKHATLTSRWTIKLEVIGVGAYLATLIFYYSQALLFRTIDMELVPVRSLSLLAAIVLMVYSRATRGTVTTIHVSRHVAYRSLVLLVVGIYLLGLGLAGKGMGHFGYGFQHGLTITLFFLSGLALFVILLSETVKRKLNCLIQRNFYRQKYDYRMQWHHLTDLLSASQTGNELLQSLIAGFCDTFGMGSGALFMLIQEDGTYKKMTSINMNEASLVENDERLVSLLLSADRVIDLRKGGDVPGCEQLVRLFGREKPGFIVPICSSEGVDGFVALGRPINAAETYGQEDFDLMATFSRQTSYALLNIRLSEQLARAREMAAIGKVSTFVLHDLKNLVSTVSLMLDNAREHIANQDFQRDMLTSLGATVVRMNALIYRLKYFPEEQSLQCESVDLLQMARETASLINGAEFNVTGRPVMAHIDRREFQKVLLNLMLNAAEASEHRKEVTVEVGKKSAPYVRVMDMGCGMQKEFLQHSLFTPFRSTKGSGMGIGLYQSKQIVEAHGGKIEVESEPNRGAAFTVWLPEVQPASS